MLTYGDGPVVPYINQLLEDGEYSQQIKKWLVTLYPQLKERLDASTKLDLVQYLWEPAGYYTSPGIQHHLLNQELSYPFGKEGIPFYLVGDTYSDLPIWIEGSLRSVREVVKLLGKKERFKNSSRKPTQVEQKHRERFTDPTSLRPTI